MSTSTKPPKGRARKVKLTHWIKAGYVDNQEHSPWKRAPMTEAQWDEAGGQETPEQLAYWEGFYAGANDAMGAVTRRLRAEKRAKAATVWTGLDQRQELLVRNAQNSLAWMQSMFYELVKQKKLVMNGPADRALNHLKSALSFYEEEIKSLDWSAGEYQLAKAR